MMSILIYLIILLLFITALYLKSKTCLYTSFIFIFTQATFHLLNHHQNLHPHLFYSFYLNSSPFSHSPLYYPCHYFHYYHNYYHHLNYYHCHNSVHPLLHVAYSLHLGCCPAAVQLVSSCSGRMAVPFLSTIELLNGVLLRCLVTQTIYLLNVLMLVDTYSCDDNMMQPLIST